MTVSVKISFDLMISTLPPREKEILEVSVEQREIEL
jgi:hypothetical protein